MTRRPERGPFRRAIEALDIGEMLFVPLPDGMAIKLHQRRCSARKALAQVDDMKWTTQRGKRGREPGVWIERIS